MGGCGLKGMYLFFDVENDIRTMKQYLAKKIKQDGAFYPLGVVGTR